MPIRRHEPVRRHEKGIGACLLLCVVIVGAGAADEGMWTVDAFPAGKVEETLGVEIDADWLEKARLSTVRIDGGCTGSFASPDGLVLTNNHCVWRCIRNLSTADRNLSESGFHARDRNGEEACPGERISVLQAIEDVTDDVAEAIGGHTGAAANEERRKAVTRLEQRCEEESGLACETVTLYGGARTHLYKYERYNDVRLVFAPELAVAAFGGDPDNFQFPRWSLDLSFLRVYDNERPISSPHHLEWRTEGARADEPVFVVGHPGTTQRLEPVAALRHQRGVALPRSLQISSELRGRMIEWGRRGDEQKRIVDQRILGVLNGLKVRRHQLGALLDEEAFSERVRSEDVLRRAVGADTELRDLYGDAWDEAEAARQALERIYLPYVSIEAGQALNSSLFGYARRLVRAAEERKKPSEERLRAYRETALPSMERSLGAPIPFLRDYEVMTLSFSLEKLVEWLGPDDPWVSRILGQRSPGQRAIELIDGSRLGDPEARLVLWRGGPEAIAESDDTMIRLAASIDAESRALRGRFEKDVEAPLESAQVKIARARFAVGGDEAYPDATFSLRVTYGTVVGWEEAGRAIEPFTRLGRLYERATGEDPFRLPDNWMAAKPKLDPDTRFNLVANTDIIGGNSGSPMLDADLNLVGLVFDGNIHSIAGGFWFDERLNRTVAVHPAAMLAALRTVYEADELLSELGLR